VLVRGEGFSLTPFYVGKMSLEVQGAVVVSQVDPSREYSDAEIREFLGAAHFHDLDILSFAIAIVERIR
jgi:hypothetical protein